METQSASLFSTVTELGTVKAEYPSSWDTGAWFKRMNWAVLGSLGIGGTLYGFSRYGTDGLLLAGGSFVLTLALIVLYIALNASKAVAVFEQGFAFKSGDGIKQIRWGQIESIWQKIVQYPANTRHEYRVHIADGQVLVLNDTITNVEEAGQAIQEGAATALFPRYVRALQAGEPVPFGPFSVSKDGLTSGEKSVPWEKVDAIGIGNGAIRISTKEIHEWASADIAAVPNFYVFYDLVRRLARLQ